MTAYSIDELHDWDCQVAYEVYDDITDELCEIAKSVPALDSEVQGIVRARIEDMVELCKAQMFPGDVEYAEDEFYKYIPTPMRDGKVDWDAVPVGASIWVTPHEGPLAGGHVLITKRQDKMAVLSGEMKRKKVKNVPEWKPFDPSKEGPGEGFGAEEDRGEKKEEKKEEKAEEPPKEAKPKEPALTKKEKKAKKKKRSKEIAARRHLAMHPGELKIEERAVKEEQKRRKLKEEREEKLGAAKVVEKEARKVVAKAHDDFLEAVGIKKKTLSKEERQGVSVAIREHMVENGHDEQVADAVADSLTRSLASRGKRHSQRRGGAQLEKCLAEIRANKLNYARRDHFEPDGESGFAPSLPSAEFESEGVKVNEPEMPQDNTAPTGTPHQLHYDLPRLPPKEELAKMTKPEIDHLIDQDLARQENAAYGFYNPSETQEDTIKPLVSKTENGKLQFAVGGDQEEKEAFEAIIQDPKAVENGVKQFLKYQEKKEAAKEIRAAAPVVPASKFSTPAMLEDLKIDFSDFFANETIPSEKLKAMSDEELAELAEDYTERAFRGAGDSSFYSALSPHWNDEIGNTLAKPTAEGAASALTALMNHEIVRDTGIRFETGRITDALGPEAAARLLAFKAQSLLTPETFKRFKNAVRDINAKVLEQAERTALAKHHELLKQAEDIEKDLEAGRFGETSAEFYRAANLDRQRRNLGVALGSMSGSAAFYDSLARIHSGNLQDDSISIMVGDSEFALRDKMSKLKLREGKQVRVEYHPTKGYIIHTTAQKMDRYVNETNLMRKKTEHWDKIKNDTSDPSNYLSDPEERAQHMIKMTFPNDPELLEKTGLPAKLGGEKITLRMNQRNDLEWLKESGGGVVARTTGAGKTLTGLAFMGHNIGRNPEYKGVIVVPNRNVDQWVNEAKVFTNLDVVTVPTKSADGKRSSTKEDRAAVYTKVKPGQVVVVGHTHAGTDFDSTLLKEIGFDGVTIDEPHEMVSPRRFRPHSKSVAGGNLTAGARRIMSIDAKNRLGLTATPAKLNPNEMYNMIHWTNPEAPGFQRGQGAAFGRAFGGFGEGTNAQDKAIVQALQGELNPYVSSGKLEELPFEVKHKVVKMERSAAQKKRAAEIEQGVEKRIEQGLKDEWKRLTQNTRDQLNRNSSRKRQWTIRIKQKIMKSIYDDHHDNLRGGEENSKVNAFVKEYKRHLDEGNMKQVVFVDSMAQKKAIKAALKAAGISSAPQFLKDITKNQKAWLVEQRKQEWKTGEGPQGIMIDQKSSVGHNLQAGSVIHMIGVPDDAAQFAQAAGRILRTDDNEQRQQVHVQDYRYTDSPWEAYHRNDHETQMKILAAAAPGVLGNLGIDVA